MNPIKARLVFLAALSLTANLAGGQGLPVTRVVLFTSGVGFFEHSGTVTGDAEVALTFTQEQVNDLLKSMILRDPLGSVGVVDYPSQDPLERSLSSFALDLGGPGGLAALLPQLRGAQLTLSTPSEITGRLVGLDVRPLSEGSGSETWLTLAATDGLRVFPLSSVMGIRILDPRLEQELGQALELLSGSRDARKKTLVAHFSGKGTRPVSIGYISDAPVWKTSYRLDLSGGKPFLQAWAMIENTGEADWNKVRLSLVSGRPVSFIQDLYTPLYVNRPVYQPEAEAGPAPRINQASGPALKMASAPAPAPAALSESRSEDESYADVIPELRTSGVSPEASGGQAGELFQFVLQTPLSLARHKSALIPLAATEVTARQVSLYNADTDPLHPQNAVWITNSTGIRLPAGPVTVYDGGIYAGDALTDSLLEKDRRLWTYATDLAVRTELSTSDEETTTKITVAKGILSYRRDLAWTTTYRFANTGNEAKTILIEHPVRNERMLVAPTAVEKTQDYHRFEVEAPAGGQAELVVKEGRTVVQTQGLAGWRSEQILALVQSTGPLSAQVKTALRTLAELKSRLDRTAQESSQVAQQKSDQENGQGRIRQNLDAVGRDSAQDQTYLKRLMDSEAQIDQLEQQLTAARQAQSAAQRELDNALKNLTVE